MLIIEYKNLINLIWISFRYVIVIEIGCLKFAYNTSSCLLFAAFFPLKVSISLLYEFISSLVFKHARICIRTNASYRIIKSSLLSSPGNYIKCNQHWVCALFLSIAARCYMWHRVQVTLYTIRSSIIAKRATSLDTSSMN